MVISSDTILDAARKQIRSMLLKPSYDAAANRKARWEQKVIAEIYKRWPRANAEVIIISYMENEPRAKEIFQAIGKLVKQDEGERYGR